MTVQVLDNLDDASLAVVRLIGALAQEIGMKAYLVGGPVRDILLKRVNLDLDISVEGKGIELAKAFADTSKGKLLTYPAFGTATVTLADGRAVDFVSARKEIYARPGAFPLVTFSSIKDDLFRRDFTINAMAVAINPRQWGKMVDPFGGLMDLKQRRLRILHGNSFIDDPTRILRAARFKARFNFKMERQTLTALKAAVKKSALNSITVQRYTKEYNKILKEKNVQPALDCLKAWGVRREDVHGSH